MKESNVSKGSKERLEVIGVNTCNRSEALTPIPLETSDVGVPVPYLGCSIANQRHPSKEQDTNIT